MSAPNTLYIDFFFYISDSLAIDELRFLTYWPISSDHDIFSSEPPFISLYHKTHVGFITLLNVSAVYGTCIVYVLGIAW